MLATIKTILAYLEWVGLIAIVSTIGVLFWSISIAASIIIIAISVFLVCYLIVHSSKKYSAQSRISSGKPLGWPLIDLTLCLGLCYGLATEEVAPQLLPFYVLSAFTTGVDFMLWVVNRFTDKNKGFFTGL